MTRNRRAAALRVRVRAAAPRVAAGDAGQRLRAARTLRPPRLPRCAEPRLDERVVAGLLERLELAPFARRRLGELSGGESQRAVLARALAQQAPVLLMDEPTASLDLGHGQMVLELVDELRREQSLCVLAALHDLTLAAQYATHLCALFAGRRIAAGSPAEVLTADLLERVFGATVEILEGSSGPSVTPVRPVPSLRGDAAARYDERVAVL